MLGTMRNNYRTPPSVQAEDDLSNSRNTSTRRGAAMLLALFLASVAIVAIAWRSTSANQVSLPSANAVENTVQPPTLQTAEIEERGITMGSEESTEPIAESTTNASVEVNGESVALPPTGNGSVHKEIVSSDGSTTTVDIDMSSSTTGSSVRGSSSLQLNVQSTQVTESETE